MPNNSDTTLEDLSRTTTDESPSNSEESSHSDGPTITFGESAAEDVVTELGFDIKDGIIVDESGEPVEPAFGDAPLTLSELGGFGKDEDGEIFIIGNDFPSLVEYIDRFEVSDRSDEPKDGDSDVDH